MGIICKVVLREKVRPLYAATHPFISIYIISIAGYIHYGLAACLWRTPDLSYIIAVYLKFTYFIIFSQSNKLAVSGNGGRRKHGGSKLVA